MIKTIKIVFSVLAFMLVSLTTNAQFKKGDKILEGTISYAKATGADGLYSLNPTLGTFLTDRFAVGISGEVGKTATQKISGLGLYGRCYVFTLGNKCHVFSQLSLSSSKVKAGSTETKITNANVGMGANYFVTKKLALAAHLTSLVDYTDAGSTSTFTVGLSEVSNPLNAGSFGILLKL